MAALPAQHRALAADHALAVAQTPAQWDELFASLAHHDQLVRRHEIPRRTTEILLPLVRVLSQDVEPDAVIGVTTDLRGPDVAGKLHPGRSLAPVPPVTRIDETVSWDPWLVVSADLRNGAHLDLTVVDVGRIQKLRKRSASGKTKFKTKRKSSQRITATLRTAKHAVVVPPAPSAATSWLRVSSREKGDRHLVVAKATFPVAADQPAGWQLHMIMVTLAELFRWVPEPDADADAGADAVSGSGPSVGGPE